MSQVGIGLYNPKNSKNVFAVLRAAGCYGASLVVSQGKHHEWQSTDTSKAFRNIPFISGVNNIMESIPYGSVPIAVEIVDGALSLPKFTHPKNAFYIFGPESGSLPNKIIQDCSYVIYIPTNYCMNLAATVNVVLYDRMCKTITNKSYFKESGV